HLDSMIAMQLTALREQHGWTQGELAEKTRMAQPRISLLEDVNYSSWSVNTLRRIARAYDVRLKVSFEEFGSVEDELDISGPYQLGRQPFTEDPKFKNPPPGTDRRITEGYDEGTTASLIPELDDPKNSLEFTERTVAASRTSLREVT